MSEAGKLTESGKGEARGRLMVVHIQKEQKDNTTAGKPFSSHQQGSQRGLAGGFSSENYCLLGKPEKLFRLL